MSTKQIAQSLRSLHHDDDGQQAITAVMLLALAAIVVVGIIAIIVWVFAFARPNIEEVGKKGQETKKSVTKPLGG